MDDWLDCLADCKRKMDMTIITKVLNMNNHFCITDITAVVYSNITSIPIFCLSYANNI